MILEMDGSRKGKDKHMHESLFSLGFLFMALIAVKYDVEKVLCSLVLLLSSMIIYPTLFLIAWYGTDLMHAI